MKKIIILIFLVALSFSNDVRAQGNNWETLGNDLYRNTNTGEVFHYDGTRQETSNGTPVFKTSAEADRYFQTGSAAGNTDPSKTLNTPAGSNPSQVNTTHVSTGGGGFGGGGIGSACQIQSLGSIASCAIAIINLGIYFLMTGALFFTVWAGFKLVRDGDKPDGRKAAGEQILAGIVALTVMAGVWGLVNILTNTFGLQNRNPVAPPQIRIP